MTKQEKKAAALTIKVKNLTDALRRAKAELKAFTAAAKTSLPEPTNTIKAPKMKEEE